MPTYEYRCDKGHAFERVQKMSEKAITRCPICGARASRVISGGQGVIFKGSGFYITDYGKDGKGPRKAPEGSAGGEEKSAPTSESAPAKSSDTSTSTSADTKSSPSPGKKDPA
jgi:putative FmdB family regulatory protein